MTSRSPKKTLNLKASSLQSKVSLIAPERRHRRLMMCTARPFKRVRAPTGQAPYIGTGGPSQYANVGQLPPPHHCSACDEEHPMGWCRIKLAGVEHCGLCGIAHLGHSRTCPHLTDEMQVGRLLQTLKESPEPREYVEAATKYLRMIRGDLMQRKRKKMEQDMNRTMQMGHGQQQHPPHYYQNHQVPASQPQMLVNKQHNAIAG